VVDAENLFFLKGLVDELRKKGQIMIQDETVALSTHE